MRDLTIDEIIEIDWSEDNQHILKEFLLKEKESLLKEIDFWQSCFFYCCRENDVECIPSEADTADFPPPKIEFFELVDSIFNNVAEGGNIE